MHSSTTKTKLGSVYICPVLFCCQAKNCMMSQASSLYRDVLCNKKKSAFLLFSTGVFSLPAHQQEALCRTVLDKSTQARQDGLQGN